MFKNKVGRPSNETIKRRKMFKVTMTLFAVAVILGGGFLSYKKFKEKDINSKSKDARIVKFAESSTDKDCLQIEAPVIFKNWRIQVYYKAPGEDKYQNELLSEDHYNDKVRKQKICASDLLNLVYSEDGNLNGENNEENTESEISTQDTSYGNAIDGYSVRVYLKATKGANDKPYQGISPYTYRPNKNWQYNSSTNWIYKDFTVHNNDYIIADTMEELCQTFPGSDDKCDLYDTGTDKVKVIGPTIQEFSKPKTLAISMIKKKKNVSIWGLEYPTYYKIEEYVKSDDSEEDTLRSESKCYSIKYMQTKMFTLKLRNDGETVYSKIIGYKDSDCSKDQYNGKIGVTNGYRYSSAEQAE